MEPYLLRQISRSTKVEFNHYLQKDYMDHDINYLCHKFKKGSQDHVRKLQALTMFHGYIFMSIARRQRIIKSGWRPLLGIPIDCGRLEVMNTRMSFLKV